MDRNMALTILFHKSGKQIKEAILLRSTQLQERLDVRNRMLDEFMQNSAMLRSYLIRSSDRYGGMHGGESPSTLYSKQDISSETKEEIDQLCRRIFELEQELRRLKLVSDHIEEDRVFDLKYNDLVMYGFETE
jgi:hypothetical protein